MSNLYEIQRHRLKLYGEMLKNDLLQKRNQQRYQKQALLKRDSIELEKHIENVKMFDQMKRIEVKQMNNIVKQDNMMLSSLKKNASFTTSYAEVGQDFVNQIHEMDNKRLNKLKYDLAQQYYDNKDFSSNKRFIQEKINEIERVETQRHSNRIKDMQMDSVKNYQEIKRKHQQDMHLYEKHRRLMEQNQSYRDQIESFTKGKGMLDRYNRNEYLQRRASLKDNQEQILKQMQEIDRRKSQEVIEYKQKVGDLQESMLASVLSKPPRYQPKVYSNQLRSQMQEDSLKKLEQENSKKQKIQLNNIYGGVHSSQRHKMIQIIDKRLGIDRYAQQTMAKTNRRGEENLNPIESNPQINISESKRLLTPRNRSKGNISSRKNDEKADFSQQISLPYVDNHQGGSSEAPSELNSSQNRRYFKSYDLITGKNRFYGAQ